MEEDQEIREVLTETVDSLQGKRVFASAEYLEEPILKRNMRYLKALATKYRLGYTIIPLPEEGFVDVLFHQPNMPNTQVIEYYKTHVQTGGIDQSPFEMRQQGRKFGFDEEEIDWFIKEVHPERGF